jgi:hypothetical protein
MFVTKLDSKTGVGFQLIQQTVVAAVKTGGGFKSEVQHLQTL